MPTYRFCDTYVYCFNIEADSEQEAREQADQVDLDLGNLEFESTELFSVTGDDGIEYLP